MKSFGTDVDLAVLLGLVRVPAIDEVVLSRSGEQKRYLFDTRGASTNLPLRRLLINDLSAAVRDFQPLVVGGIAKSGTVWGAWVAWQLDLPFANILLDGPRMSGLQREVEGNIEGHTVLLIDNWVRSGTSLTKAAEVVHRNGGSVCGAVSLVSRENVEANCQLACLYSEESLVKSAIKLGLLEPH